MGPLSGIRVLEIGDANNDLICGMLLADMGADVIRVEERAAPFDQPRPNSISSRGKSSIALDLNAPGGLETLLRLVGMVDVVLDGLGLGAAEQLGFGSAKCLKTNPGIVYGRLSKRGEEKDTSASKAVPPVESLDLLSNISSGMLLAFGTLCALLDVKRSGHGQVVDASMSDAGSLLTSLMNNFKSRQRQESNVAEHPGNSAQRNFVCESGMTQPAPTPRFSRTQPEVLWGSQRAGEETEAVLQDYGFGPEEIIRLRKSGALP
jgi:alpha-methylacyl-CoA racemase